MTWLPVILFIAIPLSIALLTGWWFGMVPLVRKIREQARIFDAQTIQVPAETPLSLKSLRQCQHIGDKTVIVHHLSKLTFDVERKIRNGMLETTVMSLVVVVFLAVILSMQPQTAVGQVVPSTPKGLWDGLKLVADRIPAFFAVPVGMFLFTMKSMSVFVFLNEQLGKFRDFLDEIA